MCISIFGRDCFDYSARGRNNIGFFCNITVLGAGFAMVEGICVSEFWWFFNLRPLDMLCQSLNVKVAVLNEVPFFLSKAGQEHGNVVAGMLFLLLQEMNASTLLCGLSVVAWCYLVEGLVR